MGTASSGDAEQPIRSRAPRADAQRNLDAIVAAAREIFARSGVDAPVRQIAEQAGVGVGTLYRHFPQRSDLIMAVLRGAIDATAEAAPKLVGQYPPGEAVAQWMEQFVDFVGTKRGLAAALQSGDPAFADLPVYLRARLNPALKGLLDAAIASGEMRADVDPAELLLAAANLAHGNPDEGRRMVKLLVDGLRYRGG